MCISESLSLELTSLKLLEFALSLQIFVTACALQNTPPRVPNDVVGHNVTINIVPTLHLVWLLMMAH